MKRLALGLALAGLLTLSPSLGAQDVVPTFQSPGYRHFVPVYEDLEPGPLHESIYRLMERCTGLKGDFEGIVWNTAAFILLRRSLDRAVAYWYELPDGRRAIWIETGFWNNPTILSHEILHDLNLGVFRADMATACVIQRTGMGPGR